MFVHYRAKYNIIVDILSEAIRIMFNEIGGAHENRMVTFTDRENPIDRPFKKRLMPNIWNRIETWTKDLIAEKARDLNLAGRILLGRSL
jgi:hypothetical protein